MNQKRRPSSAPVAGLFVLHVLPQFQKKKKKKK
jgi:hypothetical protein